MWVNVNPFATSDCNHRITMDDGYVTQPLCANTGSVSNPVGSKSFFAHRFLYKNSFFPRISIFNKLLNFGVTGVVLSGVDKGESGESPLRQKILATPLVVLVHFLEHFPLLNSSNKSFSNRKVLSTPCKALASIRKVEVRSSQGSVFFT